MQEHATVRFEADTQAARAEQILVGLVVAILGPGLIYLSGEQSIILLAVLGVVGGVAGYGVYALRYYLRAAESIELTSDSLTIAQRRGQLRLAWSAIREVRQHSHYGDFLVLHVQGQKHPHTILLEGYTREQITTIRELIEQRRRAAA